MFWSEPIAVKSSGNQDAKVYFRLFDLKPDGSDFFLYYTRPARDLTVPASGCPRQRHGAHFYRQRRQPSLQQGAFGRTLPNGGSGGAEARYLETVVFAQHQLMETNRWAMENLPWDLYLAYTPFPDEAEHVWRGYLDSTLPNYRQSIAEQLAAVFGKSLSQLGRTSRFASDASVPPNRIFALISDHGMQGINKRVALNRALQEGGLLSLDGQGRVDLSKTQCSIRRSTTATC